MSEFIVIRVAQGSFTVNQGLLNVIRKNRYIQELSLLLTRNINNLRRDDF